MRLQTPKPCLRFHAFHRFGARWRMELKASIGNGHIFLLFGKAILGARSIHFIDYDACNLVVGSDLQYDPADALGELPRHATQNHISRGERRNVGSQ